MSNLPMFRRRRAGLAVMLLIAAASLPAWSIDTMKPHATEIAPQAVHSILLDVTTAGSRLVAVGDRGHVLVSNDGRDWAQVPVPVDVMLTRVRFVDDHAGWAVGHDGTLLKTADGGRTWTLQAYTPDDGRPLYDVLFLDPQHGFVCGANGVLRESRDGGASWQDVAIDFRGLGLHIYSLAKLGDGSLLLTGEKGLLARSADAGAHWQMLKSPYGGSLFGALADSGTGVLIYGLRGRVYRADDAGKIAIDDPAKYDEFGDRTIEDAARLAAAGWRRVDNPVGESLFGGTRTADGRALLVGVNGVRLFGDAGDHALTELPRSGDAPLSAVTLRGTEAIAVGRNGVETFAVTAEGAAK